MAKATTFNYEAMELNKLAPAEAYRLKITSDTRGETRWLNITPAQLTEIRKILTGS